MTTQQVLPPGPEPATGDEPLPTARATKRRSHVGLGIVAGLIIIGVISLLGGWDVILAKRDDTLPSVPPGEMTHADPFDVTFLRAFHATELKPSLHPQEGKRLILISLDVLNTSDTMAGWTVLTNALEPDFPLATFNNEPDGPADATGLYRFQDAHQQGDLQPGLPQRLLVVWKQSETEPLPAEITVTLSGYTYREASLPLSSQKSWYDREKKVSVTLPVEEMKNR